MLPGPVSCLLTRSLPPRLRPLAFASPADRLYTYLHDSVSVLPTPRSLSDLRQLVPWHVAWKRWIAIT